MNEKITEEQIIFTHEHSVQSTSDGWMLKHKEWNEMEGRLMLVGESLCFSPCSNGKSAFWASLLNLFLVFVVVSDKVSPHVLLTDFSLPVLQMHGWKCISKWAARSQPLEFTLRIMLLCQGTRRSDIRMYSPRSGLGCALMCGLQFECVFNVFNLWISKRYRHFVSDDEMHLIACLILHNLATNLFFYRQDKNPSPRSVCSECLLKVYLDIQHLTALFFHLSQVLRG